MTTLDSAQLRLQEARKAAKSRETKRNVTADVWPKSDGITTSDALDDLSVEMLRYGARVGFGVTDGTSDIWARLAYPRECDSPHEGMVAFMTSNTIEGALCKLAQIIPESKASDRFWKADQFAR